MSISKYRNIRQSYSGRSEFVFSWFAIQFICLHFVRSEIGGRTVCRILVRDAAGENESALLHETVPSWVTEIVIEKTIPKFLKIPFYLLPHPQMVKQDRMKKVSLNFFSSEIVCGQCIILVCFSFAGSSGRQRIFAMPKSVRACAG